MTIMLTKRQVPESLRLYMYMYTVSIIIIIITQIVLHVCIHI